MEDNLSFFSVLAIACFVRAPTIELDYSWSIRLLPSCLSMRFFSSASLHRRYNRLPSFDFSAMRSMHIFIFIIDSNPADGVKFVQDVRHDAFLNCGLRLLKLPGSERVALLFNGLSQVLWRENLSCSFPLVLAGHQMRNCRNWLLMGSWVYSRVDAL